MLMRWHLDERVCIDERRQLLDECKNLLKAQGHELLLEVLVREKFIYTSVWLYVCNYHTRKVTHLQNGQTHPIHYFKGPFCNVDIPDPGNQVECEAAAEHGHEPFRGEHGRVHPFLLQVRPQWTCHGGGSDRENHFTQNKVMYCIAFTYAECNNILKH